MEKEDKVLPYELRETLNIEPGDTVLICKKGDRIILLKSKEVSNLVRL